MVSGNDTIFYISIADVAVCLPCTVMFSMTSNITHWLIERVCHAWHNDNKQLESQCNAFAKPG